MFRGQGLAGLFRFRPDTRQDDGDADDEEADGEDEGDADNDEDDENVSARACTCVCLCLWVYAFLHTALVITLQKNRCCRYASLLLCVCLTGG